MTADTLTLNDGHAIPRLGLGVWKAEGDEVVTAVTHALEHGYRHIDTAAVYGNEAEVGQGLRSSDVPRDEVFVTSKVWNERIRAGEASQAIDDALKLLQLDYLDLMLLHWPTEGRGIAWQSLIDAREDGRVRSIGVSNFLPGQLDELVAETGVVPALNQIEHHPWLHQPDIKLACKRHGIAVEAWSPLMQGRFAESPVIGEIATEAGRSEAQVVLRWALQQDIIVIPKSITPARIEQNGQLFDFDLDAGQMARIDAIDREERLGPDPSDFSF